MKETKSDLEEKLGILYYLTDEEGINGKLKEKPEDFVVEEISKYSLESYRSNSSKEGEGIICLVKSVNWETNNLIREISNRLKISRKKIGFAGNKDKKAVTKQYISIYGVEKEEIENIKIDGVQFSDVRISSERIDLGDLIGNKFSIRLKEIQNIGGRVEQIASQINKKGAINYFGTQRFGSIRPITHKVGKKIVKGKLEDSLKVYIAEEFPDEPSYVKKVRKRIKEMWGKKGFKEGLDRLPNYLRYERSMLHHLYSNPKDFSGALRRLPLNLRKLFIHSYQSYLFHKVINKRIESGLPINNFLEGDILCFFDINLSQKLNKKIPNRYITEKVEKSNFKKLNKMVNAEKAFLTAPLFGTHTKMSDGKVGEIEKLVLGEENLELKDFNIGCLPEVSSTGMRREITMNTEVTTKIEEDGVVIKFFLPKGCYATSIIREFRKA